MKEPLVIIDGHHDQPFVEPIGDGAACGLVRRCPGRQGRNEDALALVHCGPSRVVLAVADGFGGLPAGDRAAEIAIQSVCEAIRVESLAGELREPILNAFEAANQGVIDMSLGAATTLAVVEIDGRDVRPYHVGDSEIMLVGQRGKIKLRTLSHTPVGYGVEAGLIEDEEALYHAERNLVANMVGSPNMRIDVGPRVSMSDRDTLVIGTDGLFDNLSTDELVESIRKGPIISAGKRLAETCERRMAAAESDGPSKPDDVAFMVFRPKA